MREFEAGERMPAPKEIVFDELSRLDFPGRWVPAGVQPLRDLYLAVSKRVTSP